MYDTRPYSSNHLMFGHFFAILRKYTIKGILRTHLSRKIQLRYITFVVSSNSELDSSGTTKFRWKRTQNWSRVEWNAKFERSYIQLLTGQSSSLLEAEIDKESSVLIKHSFFLIHCFYSCFLPIFCEKQEKQSTFVFLI